MTTGVFRSQPSRKSDSAKQRGVTRDTFAHFIQRIVGARGFPPRADQRPNPLTTPPHEPPPLPHRPLLSLRPQRLLFSALRPRNEYPLRQNQASRYRRQDTRSVRALRDSFRSAKRAYSSSRTRRPCSGSRACSSCADSPAPATGRRARADSARGSRRTRDSPSPFSQCNAHRQHRETDLGPSRECGRLPLRRSHAQYLFNRTRTLPCPRLTRQCDGTRRHCRDRRPSLLVLDQAHRRRWQHQQHGPDRGKVS